MVRLSQKYKKEFEPQIVMRGIEYYNNYHVNRCFKTINGYFSNVYGDDIYTVKIKEEDESLVMSCTCPYKENCKHEYAILLAIDNKQYKELDLKKEIEKTNCDLDKFIKDIPAEELKTEIAKQVEKEGISFYLNMFCLNNKFSRYLPKESREYFYNNLYNALKLDEEPFNLINDYIEIIKNVIISHNYEYIFLIFTSIIDAIVDTNTNVESNHLIFIYSKLGVFLRITYRKCSEELRNQYNEWVNKYKKNNYNNDIYLEDLLITINNESSNS